MGAAGAQRKFSLRVVVCLCVKEWLDSDGEKLRFSNRLGLEPCIVDGKAFAKVIADGIDVAVRTCAGITGSDLGRIG